MKNIELEIKLQFFSSEKTEPATAKKRRDIRKKGQVFKSQDLVVAATVLIAFGLLPLFLSTIRGFALGFLSNSLSVNATNEFSLEYVTDLLKNSFFMILISSIPFMLVIALTGVIVNILQTGLLNVPDLLKPKFERINPLEGFKRMFSKKSLVNLIKSLFKVFVIGYVVYTVLTDSIAKVSSLSQVNLPDAFVLMIETISYIGVRIGLLLLFIGIIDYFYQWWEFEVSIRMSKEEIKEEFKQLEGDPQIKAKIRSKQRQLAHSRMMNAVPSADVVITNPTHVAVALKYDPEKGAPEVVAKGRGLLAAKIRDIAQKSDVPIVERPELARAIYHTAEVGQFIPADLYKAVAEVLAFVYRLKRKNF